MWINLTIILITIILGQYFIQREKVVYTKTKKGIKLKYIRTDRKLYIILISIILILQSGLRNWAVGADTYAYYEAFERVKYSSWSELLQQFVDVYQYGEGKDPGYDILQKFIQLVIYDYQIYLIVIAGSFFTALGYFLYKNTKRISDVMFAFVLYSTLFYSFFSITGIRQTIATIATLCGFELIKRKKLLMFILLILLASTVHKSVLIFLPLYFIRSKKVVKYLLFLFAVFLPLIFYYSDTISYYFQSLDDTYGAYEHMKNLKPYNFVLLNIIIFFMGVYTYRDSLIQRERSTWFWYAALLIATFFTTQVFQIHGFIRVIYYFSIFNLLLIPHMFQIIAHKHRISHRRLLTLGLLALLVLYLYANYDSEYKFFWQEMQLGTNYR